MADEHLASYQVNPETTNQSELVGAEIDLSGIDLDTSVPVLVTGANGYVASWIVAALLEAGVSVHAAVREPDNLDKVGHLQRHAQQVSGKLTLFKADLLQRNSYLPAMRDCGIVFHTASPFIRNVTDPKRDLINPAVAGTQNVLNNVNQVSSIRRVVLTSSIAAICTDAVETEQAPDKMLREDTWNTSASLDYEPYNYSKTMAEHEAWKIADQQTWWQLVVVNPALVIGPARNPNPTSESFSIIRHLGRGDMKFGAPRLGLSVVDVRDVARAQIAAAYLPNVQGRHIVSNCATNILQLATMLRSKYGNTFPLPRRKIPKSLFWLIAPTVGVSRHYVNGNVDHQMRFDNTKSQRELGMNYRPIADSLNEMFAQMVAAGDFIKH